MAPRPTPRDPMSAGGPLALAILAGVIIGAILGQPTIGFFGGLAIGLAILIAVWLRDTGRI